MRILNLFRDVDFRTYEVELSIKSWSVSENMVVDIPSLKESGKIYTNLEIELLERTESSDKNLDNSKKPKYRNLSLFDLLTPILMPSVDLDFLSTLDFPHRLFDYQVQGVKFLLSNSCALLADQMGTGKTVMTTTAIRILFIKGVVKKALVVVPSSLVSVWKDHVEKWAPEITFTVVSDDRKYREILWKVKSHLYIVSYDTLKYDYKDRPNLIKEFSKDLDLVVLDEAHSIKNGETLKSRAVKYVGRKASYRWALSGTPLQNHLGEILSIYQFLNPEKKLDKKLSEEDVKKLVRPIMLRRLKKDVIKDLPEKLPPEVERFELSPLQREYYERFLNAEKRRIEGIYHKHKFDRNFSFLIKQNIIHSLQKLRQICNFPPESISSPKSERLLEIVREILDNGEKVIIFSNFVKEGVDKIVKNLRNILPAEAITTFHGGLTQRERDLSVKRFMEDNSCKVFVGTIATSSEGLTLTAGNYVVFFDIHWNPAKMWQAEDRVHRIGQESRVNIYYFITNNTIEERIIQSLNQKKSMIESIVDSEVDEVESITLEELLDFMDLKIAV